MIRQGMKVNFDIDIDRGVTNRVVVLYHAIRESWGFNSHDVHTNVVHRAYINCLQKLEDVKLKEISSVIPRDRSTTLKSSYRNRYTTWSHHRKIKYGNLSIKTIALIKRTN